MSLSYMTGIHFCY